MDVRYTPEQAELRRTARRLARELGPRTVADLDDDKRARRLAEAVCDAGWLELRHDGDGGPLASGVEAAIIAEALGEAVADVAFAGPVLGADLARRAGARPIEGTGVAFSPELVDIEMVSGPVTTSALYAVDVAPLGARAAFVLAPEGGGYRLARVPVDGARGGADLTRAVREIPAGVRPLPVPDQSRLLTSADLDAWRALGLALTCADLVGIMRGVLELTVSYARERKQYGVPIGSFQAVQHLLAEAQCLMEGASSIALHPSWGVDDLAPGDARHAGRVAKVYCARAARTVCETAVQVHGGMGNTWDCIVHVYLRRALLSSRWFGDDGEHLRQLQQTRLAVTHGLS
ncbi:MAG TPA: acyl-CoA dehydrogenase [Myxococcota bacterium]|nr:acyl-CoA dehydrogenase [Myxococcota bacterium]